MRLRYLVIGPGYQQLSAHRKLATAMARADRYAGLRFQLIQIWDGKGKAYIYTATPPVKGVRS